MLVVRLILLDAFLSVELGEGLSEHVEGRFGLTLPHQ